MQIQPREAIKFSHPLASVHVLFLIAKATGLVLQAQDVYTLRFSRYFEGTLTTSGTGHIRFWKMASTFTGKSFYKLLVCSSVAKL
jgi:hypothetical protein